jgi:putative transposase
LEVCRYVDLNPVRARMVKRPDAYPWSSYRALAGFVGKPDWLDAQSVYDQLASGKSAAKAATQYAQFVAQGQGVQLWDEHLKQQIYLGDDDFIARMQKHAGLDGTSSAVPARGHKANVSKIHISAPTHDSDLKRYAEKKFTHKDERNQNIADAFYQGGHSQTAIASAFGISGSTVSRVVMGYGRGT